MKFIDIDLRSKENEKDITYVSIPRSARTEVQKERKELTNKNF